VGLYLIALKKLGMAREFIGMVQLMFDKVEIVVCLNRRNINPFCIKRGVKYGCPLAPYLFTLVVEVFSFMVKKLKVCGTLNAFPLSKARIKKSYFIMLMI
jgi:hypothetical protein